MKSYYSPVPEIHAPKKSFQDIFNCLDIHFEYQSTTPKSLCVSHYNSVYRHKNATKVQRVICCVCGTKRKHEHSSLVTEAVSKFLPCPSPKVVESFLADSIEFDAYISEEDVVCFKCYKYLNQVLKSGSCTLSNDHVLAELKSKEVELLEIVQKMSSTICMTCESVVKLALYKTALHTCRVIRSDHAVRFTDLYRIFQSNLPSNVDSGVCISKYSLLTFLGSEFGDLVSSFCHNKKTGTIFYRTKADLRVLLSNSFGCQCKDTSVSSILQLNDSVHKLAKHLSLLSSDPGHSLVLDMDTYTQEVCSVAPELWELVCTLTSSVNERKGRTAATAGDTYAGKIKHLRRAYILSVILFITNSECSSPFHVLLADTIESHGGSTELITILNRVGAVCSVDTLKRVIQSVSLERKAQGVQSLLVNGAFTVATADNVDFLQSHASVYAGNQHRSWHATSIQLVQPQPLVTSVGERVCRRLFDSSVRGDINVGTITPQNVLGSLPSNPLNRLRTLLSRKRLERSSPVASPQQSTRSPLPKKMCRARTFTECRQLTQSEATVCLTRPPTTTIQTISTVHYTSFLPSTSEKETASVINQMSFYYIFLKEACISNGKHMVDLKTFCGLSLKNVPNAQQSNVVYLSIIDMHADTREAMEAVVSKLHREYGIGVTATSLVLVGDQKTYTRVQELKHIYGQDLNWLIPFIGDWHLLHNLHSVLMKVYFDAGLKELAQSSGFRGETLTSLQRCSNFKRVHQFLLQAWEALYRHLQTFISDQDEEFYIDLLSATCAQLCNCNRSCQEQKSPQPLHVFLKDFQSQHPNIFFLFQDWLNKLADKYPNWKFWKNFVFRDMFSYITLFISIRGGMWNLRLYGVKQVAPLFAAFDRPHYQKLIPCHLHEVLSMPSEVISKFENGAFVCNITGTSIHSVALDEAHEMLVNKDLKTSIVRPTKEYLDRILYYYPVRSQALKVLKQQVLLDGDKSSNNQFCVVSLDSSTVLKVEENVKAMLSYVQSASVLSLTDNNSDGLLTSMSGQIATPEQKIDLLGFWEIGLERFKNKVKYFVLHDPSAAVPQRQAKLLTFKSTKSVQKKIKLIDKEKKIVNKCVRRSLVWNAKVGVNDQQCGGQYLELPRAISDSQGNPHKGQKSYATKWLNKRFTGLINNTLPTNWVPEVVVPTTPVNMKFCWFIRVCISGTGL